MLRTINSNQNIYFLMKSSRLYHLPMQVTSST